MARRKKRKHTPDQIDAFWAMRAEGWAYKEISKKIGVSYWALHDWHQFKTQVAVNVRAARKYGMWKGEL